MSIIICARCERMVDTDYCSSYPADHIRPDAEVCEVCEDIERPAYAKWLQQEIDMLSVIIGHGGGTRATDQRLERLERQLKDLENL